ncbi:Homeodomain-like [Phytophthora cactorum]|nr:Homeodomain-like [Phytophthora cactorum]
MISPKVMSELHQAKLVPTQFTVPKPGEHAWSPAEQRRFWEAIQRFPQGPWTAIAAYKLRQKLSRWKRRVRSDSVSSCFGHVTTPADNNGSQSPPMSPTEYGDIGKLSVMDHIEEEDDEKKSMDDCEPMDIKPEFKSEVQQFNASLTDIEPVLEHVAHFTNGGNTTSGDDRLRSEQAVYFTHHADMAASEHKTMEHSWGQHHPHTAYYQQHHQQQQYHQQPYSAPVTSTAMHYTPTEGGNFHHI